MSQPNQTYARGAICETCSHPYYMHPESGMTARQEHCWGYGAAYMKRLPSGFEQTAWHPCPCRKFVPLLETTLRTDRPTPLPLRLKTNG